MPDLPFGSYTFPVYLYENFSFTISNPGAVQTPITKTSGLQSGFFSDTASNLTFAGNGSSLTAGSTESFSYTVVGGGTSSNNVPVGTGRFTDLSGNGVSGTTYTFYKNEPIPNIRLMAPFALSTAMTSVPTLPPGLKFYVSGSNVDICGTPLATVPTSNYLLIGKDTAGSKVVTTSNTYSVSNERILYNLSGTPIITMDVDVPISTRVLTSAFPPYPSGGIIKYAWNVLPDGIRVYDGLGNDKTISNNFGFLSSDVSHAFVMAGTPTIAAAYSYANLLSNVVTIQGTRVNPLPAIVSNFQTTFAFNETVLFDQTTIPALYTGIAVDPSTNYFRASTYFGSASPITSIFSPDLRSDLSLSFVSNKAGLYGTPTTAGAASYTIRATNANGKTRDYVTPITVQDDFITFESPTPAVDTSFSFILSRPVELAKTGYYSYPIQFKASAASGRNVTLTAAALTGTGMSLNSNGIISGLPETITPLTTLTVTATSVGSPATASRNVKFEVLNDQFTFGTVSNFSFIQNRAMVPVQIPVSTLSERPVIGFSTSNLPTGLSISPAGIVSGTPSSTDTSGIITITPSTGYASASIFPSYTLVRDSMLLTVPQNTYYYVAGNPMTVPIYGTAYSGITVSNYDLSLSPTYGLAINSVSGIMSGVWSDNIPPNDFLPASCNFTIKAKAGSLNGELAANFTADPIVVNEALVAVYGQSNINAINSSYVYGSKDTWATWDSIQGVDLSGSIGDLGIYSGSIADIQFKNSTIDDNVILMSANSSGNGCFVFKGTNLSNFQVIDMFQGKSGQLDGHFSSLANKPGTSTWWSGGYITIDSNTRTALIRSDNDGQTWDYNNAQTITSMTTRDCNGTFNPYSSVSPYVLGGLALRYKNGILMAGGLGDMVRSVDDGVSWQRPTGGFAKETANFSLEHPTIWVATGSTEYTTVGLQPYTNLATTIKYSTDAGLTWSNSTNDFTMLGYDITYACNTWIATGINKGVSSNWDIAMKYSTNGSNWSNVDLSTNSFFETNNSNTIYPPLPLGGTSFDGTHWNTFVNRTSSASDIELYRHDLLSPLSNGWTVSNVDVPPTYVTNTSNDMRFVSLTPPHYLRTGDGETNIILNFTVFTVGGPTITGPVNRAFLEYQYIPITPIELSATGVGTVYFFIATEELPAGLTFDPLTNMISGTPAQAGRSITPCYAKDNNGVSEFTLDFTVIIPRLIRKQDGAGAYTSLLRQYTQVLGAENARDRRVLPTQGGEFMAPQPPDVVTAPFDPTCCKP